MQIPVPIHFSKKCNRCELRYPEKETQCPHCKDLSDSEVEQLKIRIEEEHEGNTYLGIIFSIMAIILFLIMIVFI